MYEDTKNHLPQRDREPFEIQPLEERIAPSALMIDGGGGAVNHGPWLQSDNGLVFVGYDPPG